MAREVIPHEASVRAWLARSRVSAEDVDELIQDAYCRIAMLDTVDHIDRPAAYFFSIARNLLIRRLKRERVVSFVMIAEIEAYHYDDNPSPERQAAGRLDYARMVAMLADLPKRCRQIVTLRKLEGWSQKEIATHLGMTEKAVEKQIWSGVKAIRQAWSDADLAAVKRLAAFEREGGRGADGL